MKKILIVGATSAIASACGRLWAAEHAEMFLVARNSARLDQIAADLAAHGAVTPHVHTLDLNDFTLHQAMLDECFKTLASVDIVLIAHGTLPDQGKCEQDVELTLREFSTNGLSVIALLTRLANPMAAQGAGTIAVISSVAGDRGRSSNYVYGAAKASVSTFCEGMRARLFRCGVRLLTVKPGFVDSPMTRNLALPRLLTVAPDVVAADIKRGIEKGSNTIYTPRFWALIMFCIRAVPGFLFKRLKI